MKEQDPAEESVNTWSSLVGVIGALAFALGLTWRGGATAGQWVFAVALLALYLSSTVYHALAPGPGKRVARVFDRVAIYGLIAGTYTPFALGPLRAHGGIWLFLLEWGMAVIGLVFVLRGGIAYRKISNVFYVAMGWMGLFFLPGLLDGMAPAGNGWILAGGIVYTVGVIFYLARQRYAHFVWHLFVLGGSACHAVAVFRYSG